MADRAVQRMIDRGVELPAVNQIETVRAHTHHDGR